MERNSVTSGCHTSYPGTDPMQRRSPSTESDQAIDDAVEMPSHFGMPELAGATEDSGLT
jgi:hypothetical protein